MQAADTSDLGLGPIDQVGYVVEDLERSLPGCEALFGPFEVSEAHLDDCLLRGEPGSCRLRLAVNRTGPVEIELIQVLEGETPHSEHLRARGEGLHHVRFRVTDLDARLEALRAAGFATVWYKRLAPGLAFAYAEAPHGLGCASIELLEMA